MKKNKSIGAAGSGLLAMKSEALKRLLAGVAAILVAGGTVVSADLATNIAQRLVVAGDSSGGITVQDLNSGATLQSSNLNSTAIARLDVLDVDNDGAVDVVATHLDAKNRPSYCFSLPALSEKWQTDQTTYFGQSDFETAGGPRVWAGDFAGDGERKLVIPCYDSTTGLVSNKVFRARDGRFEFAVPNPSFGPLSWYPMVYFDPVDLHWKMAVETAPDGFTHYLHCFDLKERAYKWSNPSVNTWLLGEVGTSMLDGRPRIWGGWYGRTLYVVDRDGNSLWRKSFGGGYEAAGSYAGNLRGDGVEALLIGGTYGNGQIRLDAARLSDGATLWTFDDATAHWSAHVIALDDVDGDGVKEVFIWTGGSQSYGRFPKYQALKGSDGTRLWQAAYPYDASLLRHARIADVDGDGAKEILLVVNNTIEARNGLTGALVRTYAFGANLTTFELATVAPASADADGDGVPDTGDQCPDTPAGEVVNAAGCSISQLVPATWPWRNHGEYVSAVAHVAAEFAAQGLLTRAQQDAIVAAAARSDIGKRR